MFFINLYNNEYISNHIKKYGLWEKFTSEILLETLKRYPNSKLIDIGANIGYFSLLAASFGYSSVAFEPISDNLNLLKSSIKLNNFEDLITVHNVGISDKPEKLVFNICDKNMGLCSTRTLYEIDHTSSQEVQVHTIDSYRFWELEVPLIFKIDVEHMEKQVLTGMKETLKSPYIRYIIIEISLYEKYIFDIFNEAGFSFVIEIGYDNNVEEGKTIFNTDTHYLDETKYYNTLKKFQKQMEKNIGTDNQQKMILVSRPITQMKK